MASIGPGAGLAGFAEGFAKAFTRGRELEYEQKAKAENFVTEQLIKGALEDPQSVVDSPELMADIAKRLGAGGDTFNQFLIHHAKRVGEDSAEAFLTAPASGQAPSAQPTATPESQMIAGQGTVLAPPAGAPAFEAPQFGAEAAIPTAQPGEAPAVGETMRIAAPPKSRAQLIQERLRPGVEYSRKFPGGRTVKLTGTEAQATKGYQYFYEERGQGLDDVTAAENAQARIVAEGGVPPKFIDDLAGSRTKTDIAVNRANAIETSKRGVATARPQSEQEFRAAAANGLMRGWVVGRSIKDDDIAQASAANASDPTADYVFQTLPDGTNVTLPREDALMSGRPLVNPSTYAANLNAAKIRNRQGPQEVNAKVLLEAIDNIYATGALELLEEAKPTEAGITTRARAETRGRYRVWDLAQKGDPRAVALQNFGALGITITRAMGSSANASNADRERSEYLTNGTSSGGIARQRADADLQWLKTMVVKLAQEGILGGDGEGATNREGTQRANTTNTTTTTTLPYNARVIP